MLAKRLCALTAVVAATAIPVTPSHAIIPVVDWASIQQIYQEVTLTAQQLEQVKSVLTSLTNVPRDLMQQAEGLLSLGVSNPLGDIEGTLKSLLNGGPLTGTCAAAAGDFITANRYGAATGGDFAGALINSASAHLGGVMSCVQTQLQSTQQRLNQMPQLLDELQNCNDVACTTAVNGRINYEMAQIQAQTNQAILMGQAAQMKRWTMQDQAEEKMRRDEEATIAGTSGTNNGGSPVAQTPDVGAFVAPAPGG